MGREPDVVVGYDGSGRARSALTWAAREAASRGLPLRLVMATPYAAGPARARVPDASGGGSQAETVLAEGIRLAGTLMGEGRVSGTCVAGHAAAVLSNASEDAALVVVGQRFQDGPVSSAVDSTSLVLAHGSRCPVVVARGATGPERALLPVAAGVNGDASSRAVLDFAAYAAQGRGVPLTIVAAWSLPPAAEWRRAKGGSDTMAQRARELSARAATVADESLTYVRRHHPTVTTRTRVDPRGAVTALERASRTASLLVVGSDAGPVADETTSRTRSGGRVARLTLGGAGCPVAVVPAGADTCGGTTSGTVVAVADLAVAERTDHSPG